MKATLLTSIAVFAMTSVPAFAREVPVDIDISTFHRNCKDMGGQYYRHTATTATCVLPSGLTVYCDFGAGTCSVPKVLPPESKPLLTEAGPESMGSSASSPKNVDSGSMTVH